MSFPTSDAGVICLTPVAGVDEAGRGPLCGPVIAAAVILDPSRPVTGLSDSKKLTAKQREKLFCDIVENALSWAVGRADVEEIDQLNILHATMLAMQRCVNTLTVPAALVLVDGNRVPTLDCAARAIVKGDSRVAEISAASVIAKVTRDREMMELDRLYPGYGIAKHKGYPTVDHLRALHRLGVTAAHRRSFRPVREALAREATVGRAAGPKMS